MLLSICILFCDKDFQYIPTLLQNIRSKCHVDFEIILIDNRKDKHNKINFENAKVFACDKLGQFNGRRLAIEKATGDYIWFVDADDKIWDVPTYFRDELYQYYDIITFNAVDSFGDWTGTWPERKEKVRCINRKSLLTHDVEIFTGPCVWNKWFKRSTLLPALDVEDTYITFNEDSLFNMIALKNSKVIKSFDATLYQYNSEVSQAACRKLSDFSMFENLLSSGKNLFQVREKLFKGQDKIETDKWISEKHCIQFFISRIYHSIPELQEKEMRALFEVYNKDDVLDCIQTWGICEANKVKASKEEIQQVLENVWKKACGETNASLSICCNFCDKDFKYIPDLIKNIKSKVKLSDYEIILCDNRTADNGKDEYIDGVKVWPTGGNLGPLGGRKEAIKHITKDYVWYLDADDLINTDIGAECQEVLNKKYDYVAFKAIDDENRVSGIWADTTEYNNQEITGKNFFAYRTYLMSGATLWNKWVKTDIFKCILDIPDTTAVCYEDALCNSYIMKHSSNMFLYNKMLYYYRCNLGDANRSNIKELASFQRTTNGGRTSLDLAKELFTKKELFTMDAWFSDLRYIEFSLKRVVDSDPSIQKDELKDLLKYFSASDIDTAFKYFTWYFDKKKTNLAYKKFEKLVKLPRKEKTVIPKLSIIISFFDKDLPKIHDMLWNIKRRMKTNSYEIILVNNCLHNNNFIPMINGIQVFASGSTPSKNKGTFQARKIGLSHAVGEYVWFIDADDKIIGDITSKELETLNFSNDLVVFNSIRDNGAPTGMGQKISETEVFTGESLLSNEFYVKAGPCLWNKWILRKNLLDILKTKDYAINAFEDTIISSVAEKHSTKALFIPNLIYEYNCSESNTCSSEIRQKDLEKIFLGQSEISQLKNDLFEANEIEKVFSLSKRYEDNFFNSRLAKKSNLDKTFCIIAQSHLGLENAFSINENLDVIEKYDFVFTLLTNRRIKDLSIVDFKNCSFTNERDASLKTIFYNEFLLSKEDFKKIIYGKSIKVCANTKNTFTYF